MSPYSRILITGGTGQIGRELVRELAALGSIVAPTRAELNLESPDSIRVALRTIQPSLVVNAAAYTLVDQAETDAATAQAVNAIAPGILAEESRRLGAGFIHFSTDYVFDGAKRTPYVESDPAAPLSVYGRTKLEGEQAVAAVGGAHFVIRTSWIYGPRGRNFPMTILQRAREREELVVVNDQVGAPTSALAIAMGVGQMLRGIAREADRRARFEAASGTYHMTAGGSTTWYDFARRILADDPRSIEHVCRIVRPTTSAEYPTAARRPSYSVLDNSKLAERFGVTLPPWTEQWRVVGEQLRIRGIGMTKPRGKTGDHGEGEHGPRTRRALRDQLESGPSKPPADVERRQARGPLGETGKQRLFENREQHDEAEQQSERRRLEELGEA